MEQRGKPVYKGRGGWRGGGRPKLASPDDSKMRPSHAFRATKSEWELLKRFKRAMEKDHTEAEKFLEALEKEVYRVRKTQK